VIASTNANELSWERSTEADLKHYRVFRDGQLLADAVEVPAYTDRTAESGKKYSYAVSAVDTYGNESPKSQPVEITTP
jgi:fibronectin type 3 domain-containing protein